MKKLLSILSSLALITSTTVTTVSCIKQGPGLDPLKIGANIKKQANAVKYDPNFVASNSNFTNYFILGDSLSDVNGLTSLINNKFNISLDFPESIKIGPIDIIGINIQPNITFGNKVLRDTGAEVGYGYQEEGSKDWELAFSNGPTAAFLLDEKLGTNHYKKNGMKQKIQPANKYIIPTKHTRNYSVGGATAAKILDSSSIFLNDVTIDEQAKTLISQHHVEKTKNDLVLLEIGGNDLFALAELENDRKAQIRKLNESMERLKNAIFILLNNGIENLIIATPPDVSVVPKYQGLITPGHKDYNLDKFRYIQQISKEFNTKMLEVINFAKLYYPNQIEVYDIYTKFASMQEWHEQWYRKQPGVDPEFKTNKTMAYAENLEVEIQKISVSRFKQDFATCENIVFWVGKDDKNYIQNQFKNNCKIIDIPEKIKSQPEGLPIKLNIKANIVLKMFRASDDINPNNPIDSYFFTDFVHPTREVHKIVSEDFLELTKKFKK